MKLVAICVSFTLVAIGQLSGVTPAAAACYEDVGCTDRDIFPENQLHRLAECEILWEMRNTIYSERGYCFSTERAMSAFGNSGCRYNRVEDVPLNSAERTNIATIQRVESRKSCPR